MKIGVLSDTHIGGGSKIELPQKMMDDFKYADMIIHAGDMVDLGVFKKLSTLCKDVRAVKGNMDAANSANNFPQKEIIKVGKFTIGVMHGYGAPANLIDLLKESFKNDFCDIIIFGHSHIPFNEKIDNVLYFNPGSPTDKNFSPYNSYGMIELNGGINAEIMRLD